MKSFFHKGFTLIELIFTIVIIGVLASVAIPKFANLTDNSKISSEMATASSVQSALDAVHGDWITSTCAFTWGNEQNTTANPLNTYGYPSATAMGSASAPFSNLLKNSDHGDWKRDDSHTPPRYYGPATRTDGKGAKDRNIAHKPEGNDYWEYDETKGTLTLKDQP